MPKFLYIGGEPSILDFSPYNVWDSEHLDIVGSTTTALDYNIVGTQYDLANLTAGGQPTFNASNFNGFPSLQFDGVGNYLHNGVSDWRSADSSGFLVNIVRMTAQAGAMGILYTSQASSGSRYIGDENLTGTSRIRVRDSTFNTITSNTTTILDNTPYILSSRSDSSDYKLWIDSVVQSKTVVGSDDGNWMDSVSNRDNITLGARIRSNNPEIFLTADWVFTGYFPYVSDAKCEEIITFLTDYYSI